MFCSSPDCSTEFTPRNISAKFCSRKCSNKVAQRRFRKDHWISKESFCKNCGNTFMEVSSFSRYCSEKCKYAFNNKKLKDKYLGKSFARVKQGTSYAEFIKALINSKKERRENLPLEYLVSMFESQEGKCAISRVPMTWEVYKGKVHTNISIDKIDQRKGYTKDNVRLVCTIVNIMRHTMSDEELLMWSRKVVDGLAATPSFSAVA